MPKPRKINPRKANQDEEIEHRAHLIGAGHGDEQAGLTAGRWGWRWGRKSGRSGRLGGLAGLRSCGGLSRVRRRRVIAGGRDDGGGGCSRSGVGFRRRQNCNLCWNCVRWCGFSRRNLSWCDLGGCCLSRCNLGRYNLRWGYLGWFFGGCFATLGLFDGARRITQIVGEAYGHRSPLVEK